MSIGVNNQLPWIRGLLVDPCGVLYDDSNWNRWLLQLVSRIGLHTSYTLFYRVWRREYLTLVRSGQCDYWQAMARFLRAAGLSEGQVEQVVWAGQSRKPHFDVGVKPFPGIRATLHEWTMQSISLGVVCSTGYCADRLNARLDSLNLPVLWRTIGLLAASSCRDEQLQSLQVHLRALDVAPSEVALVSQDAWPLSLAQELGMATVAVNAPATVQADLHCDHFTEVVERLSPAVDRGELIRVRVVS